MPTIYKRNCDYCGDHYEHQGKRFCSLECHHANRTGLARPDGVFAKQIGKRHPRFNGYAPVLTKSGYLLSYIPGPPRRRIFEHRLIMEQHLGRELARDEHVHHINGDKIDNRIENLRIMNNRTHAAYHYHQK